MIKTIILGIIQGIGEFLPISSSGHLNVFPWLFNWGVPSEGFDTETPVEITFYSIQVPDNGYIRNACHCNLRRRIQHLRSR